MGPPQPAPQLPAPARLCPWGAPRVDWGGGEGWGGGLCTFAQQGVRSSNRRMGGGTFSSPSRCDPQSNTHTQSSACKLRLGAIQPSRGAPLERGGRRCWLARPTDAGSVFCIAPEVAWCTLEHTPCWQGGQEGLMRENVPNECVRTAARACMGPPPA